MKWTKTMSKWSYEKQYNIEVFSKMEKNIVKEDVQKSDSVDILDVDESGDF